MTASLLSGLWSVLTFYRLSSVVDRTVADSQPLLALVAELGDSLEREDDALLLCLDRPAAVDQQSVASERTRSEQLLGQIQTLIAQHWPAELGLIEGLKVEITRYRSAGDQLLQTPEPAAVAFYHRQVNPRLRDATSACQGLRELHLRSMEEAAISAAQQASQATRLVGFLVLVVFVIGAISTAWLANSILQPIRRLTRSMEAIRENRFDHRVPSLPDPLGRKILPNDNFIPAFPISRCRVGGN